MSAEVKIVTDIDDEKNTHAWVVWLVIAVVVVFFVWAANAPLEIIVRGSGQVVPNSKAQVLQNLEGGIVAAVHVSEGDIVEQGAVVATMDKTQFSSGFEELREQRLALLLRIDRLSAETNIGQDFVPDSALSEEAPEYAESEIELFRAHQREFVVTLENLRSVEELLRREVEILQPMQERGAVSEIELIRAQQSHVEANANISSLQTDFETKRSQEYADALAELRQVEQQIRIRRHQLDRTEIQTPVYGVVNQVFVNTLGGVVGPGEPLIEIVPLGEELRVEAKVDPRDIGSVFVGMGASVKLTAFDYSIYGTLDGTVVHVGADTVIDETSRQPVPYYEVYVEVDRNTLEGPDGQVEIRPGMLAEVELDAGQRTVLQYLLKPLFKTTTALNER